MMELQSLLNPQSLVLAALLVAGGLGTAQAQHNGGGGGGGGGHTEAATNNLSYPAAHTAEAGTAAVWNVPGGTLGITYSFGCNQPEVVGTTTYPNTSCVDDLGKVLTAEACTAVGGKCAGQALNRIYWQKVTVNDWWADSIGPTGALNPRFLDWSDGLESVTWKATSTIRVETTPFAPVMPVLRGYQMWHVFAQGPDEQWGVRATDQEVPIPYMYQSPVAIIHTPAARLNISKLEPGASTCPAGRPTAPLTWTGSSWLEAKLLRDIPYTAELNVGGKYVYGYNWMLKRDVIEPWSKAGWWRLTFYTSDSSTLFDDPTIPLGPPPAIPGEPGGPMAGSSFVAAADSGPLYVPVIDVANNLTYLDICIAEGGSGSGGGGGGKGGGR